MKYRLSPQVVQFTIIFFCRNTHFFLVTIKALVTGVYRIVLIQKRHQTNTSGWQKNAFSGWLSQLLFSNFHASYMYVSRMCVFFCLVFFFICLFFCCTFVWYERTKLKKRNTTLNIKSHQGPLIFSSVCIYQ